MSVLLNSESPLNLDPGIFIWCRPFLLSKKKLGEILKVKEWLKQRENKIISELEKQQNNRIYDKLRDDLNAYHSINAEEELTEMYNEALKNNDSNI